ncbi:MAG: N-acetylmuramoyl-L-alanine amidase [Solobacterium sp.]|nr:N-acetylmuramoyl-L-alanine amidase [Solobacterium sp.]MBR2726751.1 N-acetylmuramoyl-L-alanine amidase [Solobacterium sp.]
MRKLHTGRLVAAVVVLAALLAGAVYYLRHMSERKPVIAVDAGHDDSQPGFEGYIREADYSLDVARQLYTLLYDDLRFDVIMVRSDGENLNVQERAARIDSAHADIVISIHANASSDPSFSGIRVAVKPGSKPAREMGEAVSRIFEEAGISCPVGYEYYVESPNGAFEMQFMEEEGEGRLPALMGASNTPSIIYEGLYVTSPADVEQYASEEGVRNTAQLLYEAVKEVYSR